MRLVTYRREGTESWGVLLEARDSAWVMDPSRAASAILSRASIRTWGRAASLPHGVSGPAWGATLMEHVAAGESAQRRLEDLVRFVERTVCHGDATLLDECAVPMETVELGPPIPRPGLCWGLVTNAPSFIRNNIGRPVLNLVPLGHQRPQGSVIGPHAPVCMERGHEHPQFGFNVELGVVIGVGGRDIAVQDAMDHVAGFVAVDDIAGSRYFTEAGGHGFSLGPGSVTWVGEAAASWGGKMADTMAPIGPWLTTKDEIADPYDLLAWTRQNGHDRDRAHSGSLILGIERVIAWYSAFARLRPGDIIHFGTMGVDGLPVREEFLEEFLELEVEIEGLGRLLNPVERTSEPPPASGTDALPWSVASARSESPITISGPETWTLERVRHVFTTFDNSRDLEDHLPRFLNGPATALGAGPLVELSSRATDVEVTIELVAVAATSTRSASEAEARERIVGLAPALVITDRSFSQCLGEPAGKGEMGISEVYGRWGDGYVTVGPLQRIDEWRGRGTEVRTAGGSVRGSTDEYLHSPERILATISDLITVFPGDVIALGKAGPGLLISRVELADAAAEGRGIEVSALIDGWPEIRTEIRSVASLPESDPQGPV